MLSNQKSSIEIPSAGTKSADTNKVANLPVIRSLGPSLGVFLFGLTLLYAVGFLPMEAAHNAAHDTRHTLAFPCH